MLKPISVSVIPTYLCNGRCPHCYLGDLVTNKKVISVPEISDALSSILEHRQINPSVNVYGGEVFMFDYSRLDTLLEVIATCVRYSHVRDSVRPQINVSSNFTINLDYARALLDLNTFYDVLLGVSFNSERITADGRSMDDVAVMKLRQLTNEERKRITANVVVLPSVLDGDVTRWFSLVESLGLGGLHFLQYSDAVIAREHHRVSGRDFENFYLRAFDVYLEDLHRFKLYPPKSEYFGNLNRNHVFINPSGQFGLLVNDTPYYMEYFKWFDNFEDWEREAQDLDLKLVVHNDCLSCEHCGFCVGEHLKYTTPEDGCCGLNRLTPFVRKLNRRV